MITALNVLNHPEENHGIELIENHNNNEDPQYNYMNIHIQSESEFEEFDGIPDFSEEGDDKDYISKNDRIANVKDNGCHFPNKKKETYKNIQKKLEMIYFRILGEKKNFKFRKIFVKYTRKNMHEKYILKNPFVEEIISRFNLKNRRIIKKIQKKNFYPQFQKIILTKIREINFPLSSLISNNLVITSNSKEKEFINNN